MFQFTRPQGARPIHPIYTCCFPCFNSRARKGRDIHLMRSVISLVVSIHAPARGATLPCRQHLQTSRVSIHAPARGATPASSGDFFFVVVSIHAPARGATALLFDQGDVVDVSIHAPARGATWSWPKAREVDEGFNSRARKGRDLQLRVAVPSRLVSIHAPARGATINRNYLALSKVFQFTRPQGARHGGADRWCSSGSSFNSRARKGRDGRPWSSSRARTVSIHAPARGATSSTAGWSRSCGRFNSRARKGRDDGLERYLVHVLRFNSRARKGRDMSRFILRSV